MKEDKVVVSKDQLKKIVGFLLVKLTLAMLIKDTDAIDPDKLTLELVDFLEILEKRS